MGSFRQGRPSFGGGRSGGFSRGGDRGGFGGGRGGFSRGGDRDRRGPTEMFDVTCSKCGKACQVPFKPTGSKPVYCSDCFRQTEGGRDREERFGGGERRDFAPRGPSNNSAPSGMSADQFKQINVKLDKIIAALDELEIIAEEEDEDLDETLDASEDADESEDKNLNEKDSEN